jgi:hypothetical protein
MKAITEYIEETDSFISIYKFEDKYVFHFVRNENEEQFVESFFHTSPQAALNIYNMLGKLL